MQEQKEKESGGVGKSLKNIDKLKISLSLNRLYAL